MNIFTIITLFGGLAMFLYGMRLMSDSLKKRSSGTLKIVMEKLTDKPIKAFLLGLIMTAVIQSSTATIVITSGLVAAGILSLHQSLGIIIGANVGTTVTGQIIRLLDIDNSATSWLQLFKPSTLAPLALIIGIVLIMAFKQDKATVIGNIAIGFGILFSGLLNMTNSVSVLNESGVFQNLFTHLDSNPFIGYLSGAGVAFILQSSSATVGILQAFSITGLISFKGIYATLVGVYLGDCVTTAIVCSIGAKSEAKRVGIVNILFNLSETVLVLVVVTIAHSLGLLDAIWDAPLSSGGIANTNTIFNLGCSILLFPFISVYEKLARKIIKEEGAPVSKYADKLEALNPVFFATPALALRSSYDVLNAMMDGAILNINRSFSLLRDYDDKAVEEIEAEEDEIDLMTDRLCNYLLRMSRSLSEEYHINIMNEYHKVVTQIERLGDHAVNISDCATFLKNNGYSLSENALNELDVMKALLDDILDDARTAFKYRKIEQAKKIEPLEKVANDVANILRDNHLERLRMGICSVDIDSTYLNLLTYLERITDVCSNIGMAVITRAYPELNKQAHSYISTLHKGHDEDFNKAYAESGKLYFEKLSALSK